MAATGTTQQPAGVDRPAKRLWHRLRRLLPAAGPYVILPFAGYGNAERILVHGRVLRDRDFALQRATDPIWRNVLEFYKHLESDELPGARVRITAAGTAQEVVADDEGYFRHWLALPAPLPCHGWHEIALELLEPAPPVPLRATAPVLLPPPGARLGVISDIDDTVVWSDVTRKLRMLALIARSNPHTRKPFAGVAAFYRALREGAAGGEDNPVFYVSGSPWNLYPPLVEFLRLQDIPAGPLLLRDFGHHVLFSGAQRRHKLEQIEAVLSCYPQLPFVLIGDSGEQDPEIYARVVAEQPGRIRAIYIRSVHRDPARVAAIERLGDEVRRAGVPLVLAAESESAAVHAATEGLIAPAALDGIRADRRSDDRAAAPGPPETKLNAP